MKSRQPPESGNRDQFSVRDVVASYDIEALALVPAYNRLSFEVIHAPVLDLLLDTSGCVLDVGAGSGRDVDAEVILPISAEVKIPSC